MFTCVFTVLIISTNTFRRALTVSEDSSTEIECPFSGVTNSGGVWRKVPESEAWSVVYVTLDRVF